MKRLNDFNEVTGMPIYLATKQAEGATPDPLPAEKSYIKICSNGIFRVTQNELMETVVKMECIPSGALEDGQDEIGWLGPKLTVEDFHRARDIFIGVYNKIKTECDMQLEWSPSLKKIILRLPHQEVSGAHVTWETQDDDPCWIDGELCLAKDLPTDAIHIGRLHSHNVMSAFWSGTDTGDQERQEYGIQIVMGKITTDPEYKCRICYCGKYIDVELHEVVDFPPVKKCEIPDGIIKVLSTTYQSTYQYGSGYQYGGGGYKGHWDYKLNKYVEDEPASDTKGNTGGTADNGGSFHKTYPQYGGYGDYGDDYGDDYSETRRPFDVGTRTGRGTGKRAVTTAIGKYRNPRKTSGKTGKSGAGDDGVLKEQAAKNAQEEPLHPAAYLISPSYVPPCLQGVTNVAVRSALEDCPNTMAVLACRNNFQPDEVRRLMTFLIYYQYICGNPIKAFPLPDKEKKDVDALSNYVEQNTGIMSEAEIMRMVGSTAINFARFTACFKLYFPKLYSFFDAYHKNRHNVSFNEVYGDLRWDPTDSDGIKANNRVQVASLINRMTDICTQSNISIPAYLLVSHIAEKEWKQKWFLNALVTI